MSNKDVRRPAPGAKEDFAARQAEDVFPRTDDELLASFTQEEREHWIQEGYTVKGRLDRTILATRGPVSDKDAVSALDICTRFLRQLVTLTSAVLDTIDVSSVRKIVAAESRLPRGVAFALKAAEIDIYQPAEETNEPEHSDHRKRPRGARHPLMVLLGLAAQATRMIQKITAGTNPHSQNLLTQEERLDEKEADRPPIKLSL